MKFFVIQCSKDGIPSTDLGFSVINAILYHKWYRTYSTDYEFDYVLVKDDSFLSPDGKISYCSEGFIPIGDIEFTEKFLLEFKQIIFIPINIPKELNQLEFLSREISYLNSPKNKPVNIKLSKKSFVKNIGFLKGNCGETSVIDDLFLMGERVPLFADNIKANKFLVSDLIEIKSEWRGFVYREKLLDLKNYSGDFTVMPNISKIQKMINAYLSAPSAYTIDVAVLQDGDTVLIECHNFLCVGLYGFEPGETLLYMLSNAFKRELKSINISSIKG